MPTEHTTTDPDACGLLERTAEVAALGDALAAVRSTGAGRLVLVAGEAGIGKTALVRFFAARARAARDVWAGCDPLHTPRPLGPVHDLAEAIGGEAARLRHEAAGPAALASGLARELRRVRPTLVVLEDVHWADEATLDVVRLLVRRLETVPALLVLTYRDDGLAAGDPLRLVLGEAAAGRHARRLQPAPLSLAAVAALARTSGADPVELHRRAGGNPFFVTEVLAAGGGVPGSVRDAVLARAARLGSVARAVLEAVAVVPQRVELWLLEALLDGDLHPLDECLTSGMLRDDRHGVAFRHEIARVTIDESLPPHRRLVLHRRALAALEARTDGAGDLARLAHHADAAGEREAVLRVAPAAADQAAAAGAHREAAAQLSRALRYGDGLPAHRRAELLERRSYECYLTNDMAEAIAARRAALEARRAAGDRRGEGDAHRWLSRLAWFMADRATAEVEARRAVELLEPLPPGRELAMAYSNMAHLRMLASDPAGAAAWGGRAIEMAERLGDVEILVHALNNVGTAAILRGSPDGEPALRRSLELALEAGLEEHVARAYTNLGTTTVDLRDYTTAARELEAGLTYCRDRDLDSWSLYMTGYVARVDLDQGRWDMAARTAATVLSRADTAPPSRITPLTVLGRLRARRGDRDVWPPLDEALELARTAGEIQRIAPVAIARSEARWLAGESAAVAGETEAAMQEAFERGLAWWAGELAVWRRRAGIEEACPDAAAEPFRLELDGQWAAAAELWTTLGCPYEAALALAGADDEHSRRRALAELQRLGARRAAGLVARELRRSGTRDVRLGPRAATSANPAGLSARELQVLALVAEGLRNADIAARLFLSEKTVDHHVSAILRKLAVRTRTQASAEAARLGITGR